MNNSEKFVDIENSRPGTHYENVISKIRKDGVCPFCPEQLANYHTNPILRETRHWKATDNMYPYKAARHHVLFIYNKHITHVSEMEDEAWAELFGLYKEEIARRNIEGGTLLFRFGDTRYTGASVGHLHAHLIQSNPDDPEYKTIKQFTGLAGRIG